MDDQRHAAHTTWLVGAGLLAVTVSSAVAVFRGRAAAGDTASVAFVVATYVTLLLLFACLRAYERAPPPGEADGDGGGRRGRRRRIRIRRAVWCLTTLLTAMFASRVAGVMPCWPAALLVWALAAATAIGGFVALFQFQPRQ